MFERLMIVSIPSPSGLLQNLPQDQLWSVEGVSIPSPSGLLQNGSRTNYGPWIMFQSLLLQVSFKTAEAYEDALESRFNPFSFRSPSKH